MNLYYACSCRISVLPGSVIVDRVCVINDDSCDKHIVAASQCFMAVLS